MKSNALRWIVGGMTVLVLGLYATAFQVREGTTALVTRFGEPVRDVNEAGLAWKLPWPIDRVATIDRRWMSIEPRQGEVLTRDKKNIILLAYAVWRVEDPWQFHRSIGTADEAQVQLDSLLLDAQAQVMGGYDLSALVSTDETKLAVTSIEGELLAAVREASQRYGIEVSKVAFKRLSFPEESISPIFQSMRQERQTESARLLAEGETAAAEVRAETTETVARIQADAAEEAERIRGDAEAEAAATYAEAHALDPELFEFLRQLEFLENALVGNFSTPSLILRTDAAPFSLLGGSPAGLDDEEDSEEQRGPGEEDN